ncbi:hypothetical protein [Massilia putida]|uniref:hypothetical protein n=1 Tax=Massilia putida TaxID=1141883 RepID=UPI0012EB9800|nr:hypothetical protein [Massilia putida]
MTSRGMVAALLSGALLAVVRGVENGIGDAAAQVMVAAWLGLLALLVWRRQRVTTPS